MQKTDYLNTNAMNLMTPGINKFLLIIEDYCGNKARYEASLIN